jgi:hypothetical protein
MGENLPMPPFPLPLCTLIPVGSFPAFRSVCECNRLYECLECMMLKFFLNTRLVLSIKMK